MVLVCDKPCGNKNSLGYCKTTACINPQFSNIGTVYYGSGAQKAVITNADRIRAMSDEELAEWLDRYCFQYGWLEWLKQEVDDGQG